MDQSPTSRVGYILAREWLYSNYFLWAALLVTGVISCGESSMDLAKFSVALSLVYMVPYSLFLYIRGMWNAWRITRGDIPPPRVNEAQLNEIVKRIEALASTKTDG